MSDDPSLVVLRLVDVPGDRTRRSPDDCRFLQSYDPYADASRGHVRFTSQLSDAMTFASAADVLAYVQTPHPLHPIRADGQPNRPLTAYTFESRRRGEFAQRADGRWHLDDSNRRSTPPPGVPAEFMDANLSESALHQLKTLAPDAQIIVMFPGYEERYPVPFFITRAGIMSPFIIDVHAGRANPVLTITDGRTFDVRDAFRMMVVPFDSPRTLAPR
jgi:hypothetical protein